jgi:hypothetical protein
MNRLKSGFAKLRDQELDDKTQSVIASLTGNAALPVSNRALAFVQERLDAHRAALASIGRDRLALIKTTRTALRRALEQLAHNLEAIPHVTDAQLAASGFDLRKSPTFSDKPVNAPVNVRMKSTGTRGEVQIMCNAVVRAKAYQVQLALDLNAGPWTDAGIFPSTRRMIISGLERGKDHWTRVRAIGPKGAGAWSDPATIMVT